MDMLETLKIPAEKKALILALDDVLFPKKDYLLQVYYLFAHLLEYTETVPPAADLTEFLKTAYLHHGEGGLFDRAAEVFGIDSKYKEPFDRMHITANLPLKLLLFPPVFEMLQEADAAGKRLFILTGGTPAMQLNKLKHTDWQGLDRSITVYFGEELMEKNLDPMKFLLEENGLQAQEVLYIYASGDEQKTFAPDMDRMHVGRILNRYNP